MRGAAMVPFSLASRQARAFLKSLPTSRTVVIPHDSQIFHSYAIGCGTPALETDDKWRVLGQAAVVLWPRLREMSDAKTQRG